MEENIHYRYAYFHFNWTWIRDKQIIHKGNQYGGTLFILDEDGNMLRGYGYELIM
jgi:hypothetical protein